MTGGCRKLLLVLTVLRPLQQESKHCPSSRDGASIPFA